MRSIIVPDGEFTFRNLCNANPSVLPLTVLRFITEQITQGKLAKKRADANTSAPTYISIPATSSSIPPTDSAMAAKLQKLPFTLLIPS